MTPSRKAALDALDNGYPYKVVDRYLMVENPKYQPDNGENPNLIICLSQEVQEVTVSDLLTIIDACRGWKHELEEKIVGLRIVKDKP